MDSRQYTLKMNQRILKRFDSRCAYCGKILNTETMTRDHIVPVSKGGANKYANFFPCCHHCNVAKGNYDLNILSAKVRFNKKNKLIASEGNTATSFYFEKFIFSFSENQ